jgi:hypothetical protein
MVANRKAEETGAGSDYCKDFFMRTRSENNSLSIERRYATTKRTCVTFYPALKGRAKLAMPLRGAKAAIRR